MIDTFQWYVWPADSNLHEGFPFGPAPADSPQARRLQCLIAEARAAGVPTRVLFAVLLDWARVLEKQVQGDAWHGALREAITITDAALYRLGQPMPESLQRALDALDAAEEGQREQTPALRVANLLGTHYAELLGRGGEADPETAWDAAAVTLGALAEAVGPEASQPIMAKCAQLAYGRLFPQRA
jgi:hypothetical protein